MKRILITGGSSYLGQHLVPLAVERFEVCHTYFSRDLLGLPGGFRLDLRDGQAVSKLVTAWRPDAIIHTAGSNRTPDMGEVIEQGTAHLLRAARIVEARLIHISTDVVFDGRNAPYRETDRPNPLHAYGRAKAEAEKCVAIYPDHVIVRTSLIFGLTIMDHSTRWITDCLSAGKPVKLFSNQIRNPVWAETLSQSCLELVHSDFRGILHVAGRQALSRAEYGLRLLDWWGVRQRDYLTIGHSDETWPLDCRLDISLAEEILSTPLLGLGEVISRQRRS